MKVLLVIAALFVLWLIGGLLFAAWGDWQVVNARKEMFRRLRD